MSLGKYFWERYPLFQRFLKEPSRNLTLWWCDRLTPISFSSCSVNQEKCHISWKPGDKIAFLSLKLLWRTWREWLLPLQIFIAHSRWNLFLQVSEQERFLESQVVHFGIGTPSRILKLIQNGERALFVISRLQIASLHAFIRDNRLLSKPRSSPSILVLRHDHGTSVSSFRWERTRPWATRTPENLSLHDLSQISPRAEKRASCSANNKSLLGSYC